MIRITALVLAPLLAGCGAADRASEGATTGDARGATAMPAASPPADSQEIYIDGVAAGNPLLVRGRARTFENNVVLRVRDARGELVVEDFTTSQGEIGHHNPFEARLWLPRHPGARVTVDAFEYSAKDGSVRSLTSRSLAYPVPESRVVLDFPTTDCSVTRPFERAIPRAAAIARATTEALVAGPDSAERARGATSPFPRGARVNSVILRDGVLTVDFGERLRDVGGACAAQGIRAAVTRTLERLPTVRRVVITVAGSEREALQP